MIEIDEAVAQQMIRVARPLIRQWGYKEARNHALKAYSFEDTTEEETVAYELYLDRYFNKRAVEATKLKYRPRPPLQTYEGDTS